ncbi:MAG: 2-amino-4-hydroxy-6-hydroxymethyldihydropteridine diphosphokinase, partial [Muribaculaceae bacterium]|nr:2-amino-4-hydroxy-6-hydroxymethyldihydropteridine diphosphokinase [Muribaculaceae bacterium]
NIVSNRGDRPALVARAVALIVERLQPKSCRVSTPVESEPWGFESEHAFLNIGMDVQLDGMPPEALLDCLQAIEKEISAMPHRNSDGSYRDREIDIDIILIDDMRIDSPRLQVPHPRMLERDFVMIPLRELRGEAWTMPRLAEGL